MYTEYFDLKEEPFSISANPRFLYMSAQHREALAHLLYGIRIDSGFVMLTGEVGTGKTTVCRSLMEQLPEHSNIAFILNPRVTVNELLSSICDEFGIGYEKTNQSVKTFVDAISHYLLEQNAQGRKTVVIIDEAQNLSFEVLEQLRLLTNLETNEHKLLRILLLGQPELETMLAQPEFKQLEQRITARFCLHPLSRREVQEYVVHRLAVAGCRKAVFPPKLMNRLYAKTRGVPRLINIVCDRAMLGAYVKSRHKVSASILDEAIREVKGKTLQPQSPYSLSALTAALVASIALALWFYADRPEWYGWQITQPQASTTVTAAPGSAIDKSASPSTETTNKISMSEQNQATATQMPDWPEDIDTSSDTDTAALAELFKAWGLEPAKDSTDPCQQAIASGLRCYSGFGNLGVVSKNDRPAILTLLDNNGRGYQVTLTSLQDELATLAFADGKRTVTIDDLESRWQGRYQLLWRMSPGGFSIFRPDEKGTGITWLTENLKAAGIEPLTVKDHYDSEVFEAVAAFQRIRGLVADGIAGRQTLMHLNSINDKTIPKLSHQGEG